MSEVVTKKKKERPTTKIVIEYRMRGLNNTKIAELIGCSRENIRQILKSRGIYSPRANYLNRDVEEGMDVPEES